MAQKLINGLDFQLLRLVVAVSAAATIAGATDHIVGGDLGWNPNINYTPWAQNQTFFVHDLISFRYTKNTRNVFEVNETGYDNCTLDGAMGNWSSGKDFIPLDRLGQYYFVCGNGLCFSGMKVAIRVLPLPSGAASNSSATTNKGGGGHGSSSTAAAPGKGGERGFWIAFAVAWFGLGFAGI